MSRQLKSVVAIAVLGAVLIAAGPLAAQDAAQSAPQSAPQSVSLSVTTESAPSSAAADVMSANAASLAPTSGNLTAGVRVSASQLSPAAMPERPTTRRSTAMMIVGGATLIVGAVIGGKSGTIVMVVGGAIGLVGLWNYLQ